MQRQQQNTYSPDELKAIRVLMVEDIHTNFETLPDELTLDILRRTGLFGYQGFLCTTKANASFSDPINELAAKRRSELFDDQCFTSPLHMVSPL